MAGPGMSWQGAVQLGFRLDKEKRTVPARIRHRGPFLVQRPFYPAGPDTCHSYLIHPPGGVAGGDELELDVEVDAGASALLTTPAAGKFYRAPDKQQTVHQKLRVAEKAQLEYLPMENICFAGARLQQDTRIHLADSASLVVWDVFCLGRPAAGEVFREGWLRQSLEIYRGERLIFGERQAWEGGSPLLTEPVGLAGAPAGGTMIMALSRPPDAEAVRRLVPGLKDTEVAVTAFAGLIIVRVRGRHASRCRETFSRIREGLPAGALNRRAGTPRIWAM